ncbi:MAG: MCE family protein [Ignavibacteria bacterium]|nr:MCE family protein [Ignavibacteria bacterium]
MKKPKINSVLLGVFVIGAFALFIGVLFLIGSRQQLFSDTFKLKSNFENVAGLREGSFVNYSGITVGSVDEINIISGNQIEVVMIIDKKVKEFIKKDSKVSIVTEGLVGNKIIEISPGSVNSSSVESGDVIASVKPVTTEDILINLNKAGESASNLAGDLSGIVQKVNEGKGTLGQLINNETLYYTLDSTFRSFSSHSGKINTVINKLSETIERITSDFDQLSSNLLEITNNFTEVSEKINSSQSLVGTLLTDTLFANNLKEVIEYANKTTQNLERGAFGFYQNMEALKHNFLFKGYFEDMGYWDKADVEKTLEEKQNLLKQKDAELKILEHKLRDMNKEIKNIESEIEQKNRNQPNSEQ